MLISAVTGELGIVLIALDRFLSGDTSAGLWRLLTFLGLGVVFASVLRRSRPGGS
ncbi:hypothetical protein GCM10022223_38990 [Kineosporia mesophila]|uniref:Uncharacterized protein n=2 Tax=Kineosporia mesophila TaxID=566012 RepID=A0ABP6ZTK7_9ACTN